MPDGHEWSRVRRAAERELLARSPRLAQLTTLRETAAACRFELPHDAAEYLAAHVPARTPADLAELRGLLFRAYTFASVAGRPLSVELVKQMLESPTLPQP